MPNFLLFLIPSIIWGSTWLVIKFQLGTVDPLVSVAYRFFISGILLLIYCYFRKHKLKFSFAAHRFMFLHGIFLFGFNYWCVYMAEIHLTSGLVSIIFSLIIFMNIFNAAVFLKSPVSLRVVAGGFMGITGTFVIFQKELTGFSLDNNNSTAILLALGAVFMASLGNIISARNQKKDLPVVPTTAWSMLYGSISMFLVALFQNKDFNFDTSFPYIASMGYLIIFGSIVAFTNFLTLVGRIGADKAAYVAMSTPVIAMVLSTLFEGFTWGTDSFTGVALILAGNAAALYKKRRGETGQLEKAS